MPQITVDYSAELGAAFDRTGFAEALHSAIVEIAAAKPEACKTQFRRSDYTLVGFEEGHAMVHVTIGLLAGRTDETKAQLTEAVVRLLHRHIEDDGWGPLHTTAEIRDLDPSYRKLDRP